MQDKILKDILKIKEELNIDIIGVTDCRVIKEREELLINRILNHKNTEFEEIVIENRIDPSEFFEPCKSIITVGISYNTDYQLKNEEYTFEGKLSKTSWGEDYHTILNKIMGSLVLKLEEIYKFKYKITVDTGPLLDREIAYKSGIGYFGKNNSIINPEHGSFIFLGYILTDLEIDSIDERIKNLCGECQLCIDACPTQALESAFSVNPKKCISYLTQTKGYIELEYRDKMKNQLYGCDICQSVCPKNKEIVLSNRQEFYPLDTNGVLDIEEILNMSNREFKEKYGYMSGSWRGKSIFVRNSIIALGNTKVNKDKALKLLEKELVKSDHKYKEYILWAIDKLKE